MQPHIVIHSVRTAAILSAATLLLIATLFLSLEPTVSRSANATDQFTVTQVITGEISFDVITPDVTMQGAINGLTGGNATGTTYAVVKTNSATGYVMDISFGSSSPAMRGILASSTGIRDYAASSTPTFAFVASTSAVFAYTVSASNTPDVAAGFLDNGSSCGSGGTDTVNACWQGPSTGTYRIINRTSAAASGATTTVQFRVNVPSNPVPSVNADTYTATATLTATNQ